jgi:AraC-like DNA-binding protein
VCYSGITQHGKSVKTPVLKALKPLRDFAIFNPLLQFSLGCFLLLSLQFITQLRFIMRLRQKISFPVSYLIICCFLLQQFAAAQSAEALKLMSNKGYDYFREESEGTDSMRNKMVATAWLKKAKAECNWKEMADAYKSILYLSDKKDRLKYSDSLLATAKNSGDKTLIGKAYLTRGVLYYGKKNLNKALDNYILANEYLSQTKDFYAIYKLKYSIAHTKYYLGFYEEAISLFKECITYFENENDIAYLNSLHSIGLCYNKTGQYNTCSYYNLLGLQAGIELENFEMEPYFRHSEAINKYYKKEYQSSIAELKQILPSIIKKKDFANETVAYFYIGKSYLKLKQENKAMPYFYIVDKAFIKHSYIRPDLRENYEILIDHHTKKHNPKLQLTYINRLLSVDSILNQNYKYLSKKIFKEYDTKKLLLEKKQLEESLHSSNSVHYSLITALLFVTGLVCIRNYKNKKRYRERFEQLMSETTIAGDGKESNEADQHSSTSEDDTASEGLGLNAMLTEAILQNLEKFEKNKKYLEKDMNVIKVAGYLKTNSKYATKIILQYRNKKSIEYISDLKIDYVVMLLKTQNKYRYYTYKALAEEVGFGTAQHFAKAFNSKIGMPPSFFIEELKKSFPL